MKYIFAAASAIALAACGAPATETTPVEDTVVVEEVAQEVAAEALPSDEDVAAAVEAVEADEVVDEAVVEDTTVVPE